MGAMRGVLFLTLLGVGAVEAQSFRAFTAADLEGAWIRKEGISAAGVAAPSAPAVRTFVDGHFSWVQAAANRPAVDSTSTAAQLRAVWGGVTARSGTYEVVGYTMTERPIADRVPAGMASGAFATFAIRLVADTMWITQVLNATNGVLAGQGSGKYVRVR